MRMEISASGVNSASYVMRREAGRVGTMRCFCRPWSVLFLPTIMAIFLAETRFANQAAQCSITLQVGDAIASADLDDVRLAAPG